MTKVQAELDETKIILVSGGGGRAPPGAECGSRLARSPGLGLGIWGRPHADALLEGVVARLSPSVSGHPESVLPAPIWVQHHCCMRTPAETCCGPDALPPPPAPPRLSLSSAPPCRVGAVGSGKAAYVH